VDRTAKGAKLPMEDMCQLSEKLTENKYRGSYEQIAKLILHYSSAPKLDLERFWEIVLFSWITGNSDMHLKNFSLYAPKGSYILSPAYDLVNTLAVIPSDPEELALNLNGKKRKITWADFVQAMTRSGVPEKVQENIRKRFLNAQPQWEETIRNSFLSEEPQERYRSLVSLRMSALM
jgi:serine/threonine-protein kinase HipA